MQEVYLIKVSPIINNVVKEIKISGEGYFNLSKAIQFIESRSDKPKRQDIQFKWVSKSCIYEILFVRVV